MIAGTAAGGGRGIEESSRDGRIRCSSMGNRLNRHDVAFGGSRNTWSLGEGRPIDADSEVLQALPTDSVRKTPGDGERQISVRGLNAYRESFRSPLEYEPEGAAAGEKVTKCVTVGASLQRS